MDRRRLVFMQKFIFCSSSFLDSIFDGWHIFTSNAHRLLSLDRPDVIIILLSSSCVPDPLPNSPLPAPTVETRWNISPDSSVFIIFLCSYETAGIAAGVGLCRVLASQISRCIRITTTPTGVGWKIEFLVSCLQLRVIGRRRAQSDELVPWVGLELDVMLCWFFFVDGRIELVWTWWDEAV